MSSPYVGSDRTTIIENAVIYTMDRATPRANALAWRGAALLPWAAVKR